MELTAALTALHGTPEALLAAQAVAEPLLWSVMPGYLAETESDMVKSLKNERREVLPKLRISINGSIRARSGLDRHRVRPRL